MAFHKNYHVGDVYKHTSARENDISMALNRLNGFRLGGLSASSSVVVRVSCYNSTSEKITAGSAVMFSEDADLCSDAIPIEKCSDDSKPFAVLENTLESNKIGNAIVAGATTVNVSGEELDYVAPNISTPGSFKYSDTGTARVLFVSDGKAIILLGGSSGETSYNGPFAVDLDDDGTLKVSSGYLNRNGEFLTIAAATGIAPSSGILCLCSTIEDGAWTTPSFSIATPAADAYPIAGISVDDSDVSIKQYPVSVAVILLTKVCPLTTSSE